MVTSNQKRHFYGFAVELGVSSHSRHPSLESGEQRRLKTINRTSASASNERFEDLSALRITFEKPNWFHSSWSMKTSPYDLALSYSGVNASLVVRPIARFRPLMSGSRSFGSSGRGRDEGYPPPPAQIRASGTTAHGSYLGCDA